jgi:ankyrin repeat protein
MFSLFQACNRGNRGVVRVLLEFGADLNLKGFGKDSPMHDAARNGHIKVRIQAVVIKSSLFKCSVFDSGNAVLRETFTPLTPHPQKMDQKCRLKAE